MLDITLQNYKNLDEQERNFVEHLPIQNIKKQNLYFQKIRVLNYKIFQYFKKQNASESSYYNEYINPYYYIKKFIYISRLSGQKLTSFLQNIEIEKINLYFEKYSSITYSFLQNYEFIYSLDKKYMKDDVIEISTNPSFFEVFHYFQNYFSLFSNIHYTVYFTNQTYIHQKEKNTHDFMNHIKDIYHFDKNYEFIYTPQFLPLTHKYDFMILNLFMNIYPIDHKNKSYRDEFFYNLDNILLQITYLQHLKEDGSCLFYIHSLYHTQSHDIFYYLLSIFQKIEIIGRPSLDIRKTIGGVFLYCIHKRKENEKFIPNRNKMMKMINQWNLQEDYKKYILLKKYYQQLKKSNHNLIDIRKYQMIQSYQWAKKYNFPILPIYESYIPSSFAKIYTQYFQINQSSISCNFHSSQKIEKSSIEKIQRNIFFLKRILERYEIIHKRLKENIQYKKLYELSTFAQNISNLPFYIEHHYHIPFVNYEWIQYFDLFSSYSSLFNKKSIHTLHINDTTGMSISSLFYYLQMNSIKEWNWEFTKEKNHTFEDIFNIYEKYKSHSFENTKESHYDFILRNNIDFPIESSFHLSTDIKQLNQHGKLIYHIHFDNINFNYESFYEWIYKLYEYFEKIEVYRSQWELAKNDFFVIAMEKRKDKKDNINQKEIQYSIEKCFVNLFTQYQFEIEKSYFIFNQEKKLQKSQKQKIKKSMIHKNKLWCKQVHMKQNPIFF